MGQGRQGEAPRPCHALGLHPWPCLKFIQVAMDAVATVETVVVKSDSPQQEPYGKHYTRIKSA